MRNTLLASAVAFVALAAPGSAVVAAGTSTNSVTIDGNIALKCTLSITHSTLTLGDLVTNDGGKHVGGLTNSTAFLDGSAMCNGARNEVKVAALPLTTETPASGGFTNRIDYTLVLGSLLPGPVSLDTSAGGLSGVISDPTNVAPFANTDTTGALFTTLASSSPVVAGAYNATVTITLTAGN